MPERTDELIALGVAGAAHRGWSKAEIELSIERVAGAFSLELSDAWSEAGQLVRRPISSGASCVVSIGGEIVVTGHLDEVSPSFDEHDYRVRARGRDATGDLVDAAAIHPGSEWLDAGLDTIARDVCAPFAVPVSIDADIGPPFERVAIEQGESVYELLERLARQRAVLLVADGVGGLALTQAGSGGAYPDVLTRGPGGVILKAEGRFNDANRFGEYIVRGSRHGVDGADADELAMLEGRARDGAVKRRRPKIIVVEQQGDRITLAQRAGWEARVRAGRARRIEIELEGWRSADGRLWRPNRQVRVVDDWLAVDAALLIVSVKLMASDAGLRTSLSLLPPHAFDVLTAPPEEDDIGWGREKTDATQGAAFRRPGAGDRGGQR